MTKISTRILGENDIEVRTIFKFLRFDVQRYVQSHVDKEEIKLQYILLKSKNLKSKELTTEFINRISMNFAVNSFDFNMSLNVSLDIQSG